MDKKKQRPRQRRRSGKKTARRGRRNRHHLNPSSRKHDVLDMLGNYSPTHEFLQKICRTKRINTKVHDAWHRLFSNMLAWEVVEQIKIWANEDLSAFSVHINNYQKSAWNKVFGLNATPGEAIEIIKEKWWPEYPTIEEIRKIQENNK